MINPDCNYVEQQARQDELDALYFKDGRDEQDHPYHALYTNLYPSYQQNDD